MIYFTIERATRRRPLSRSLGGRAGASHRGIVSSEALLRHYISSTQPPSPRWGQTRCRFGQQASRAGASIASLAERAILAIIYMPLADMRCHVEPRLQQRYALFHCHDFTIHSAVYRIVVVDFALLGCSTSASLAASARHAAAADDAASAAPPAPFAPSRLFWLYRRRRFSAPHSRYHLLRLP